MTNSIILLDCHMLKKRGEFFFLLLLLSIKKKALLERCLLVLIELETSKFLMTCQVR